jgi:NADP-dependent 3-hydroxy acid dehydrogenase YdfG
MSNNIESKVVVITGAAMSQPDDVDINEIPFRPTKQEL